MGSQTYKIIVGVSVGIAIGILIGCSAWIVIMIYRKRFSGQIQSKYLRTSSTLHICANDISASIDSNPSISVSDTDLSRKYMAKRNAHWNLHQNKDLSTSLSGIPRYSYKVMLTIKDFNLGQTYGHIDVTVQSYYMHRIRRDIQRSTQNFTTLLGQGSFGPVYKATMPTGELVAVKVLASDSSQGEKEFQTEVLLLSRLHHRNLVNLVGYCVDKNQHMLIYEFMSNGNLASLLYNDGPRILSWEERLQIASDISHGIEYLHEGAVPPIVHRDLKSANILLDKSMRAKVADFGLSKEETIDARKSGLKGTYGYMDPDYMSTNRFTKKSDIYSFGIILFELITAINPQQGLLDYIDLAMIGEGGKAGWEEILDKKLVGHSYTEDVSLLADIAYKCLDKIPQKRPSIIDVGQAISRIRRHLVIMSETLPSLGSDAPAVLRRIENQHVELSNITNLKSSLSLKA